MLRTLAALPLLVAALTVHAATAWKPEDYMIAVSGDPLRNNAYVFAQNGFLGYPTGKKIKRLDPR